MTRKHFEGITDADVDKMSYTEMLKIIRFYSTRQLADLGSQGQRLLNRMDTIRRGPCGDELHAFASKSIGWGKRNND
jgi:hypothetical protein